MSARGRFHFLIFGPPSKNLGKIMPWDMWRFSNLVTKTEHSLENISKTWHKQRFSNLSGQMPLVLSQARELSHIWTQFCDKFQWFPKIFVPGLRRGTAREKRRSAVVHDCRLGDGCYEVDAIQTTGLWKPSATFQSGAVSNWTTNLLKWIWGAWHGTCLTNWQWHQSAWA